MKVRVFRAFPDGFRKSMQIYADQLIRNIQPLLQENEEISDCLPARIHLKPKIARYWDQYVRYQGLARACGADVNHIIDPGYGHLAHSLPARRTVVTFHDCAVTKLNGVAQRTRFAFRYSLTGVRKADVILTSSETTRRDLLNLVDYPDDKVKVIYLGIADGFQVLPNQPELRRRYQLPQQYILSVGHTLPYANVEALFLVLDCLIRKHGFRDIRLVKVGDQFTQEQERLLDSLALRGHVQHLGRVAFRDLPAIYNCAEVFVYPVLYAGFGLPPLEAMACGVPVVCSDRGALPEVAANAAITAHPEDYQRIAEHVAVLMTDRSVYERYRSRGLERSKRYSWTRTARQVLGVYRQVADA